MKYWQAVVTALLAAKLAWVASMRLEWYYDLGANAAYVAIYGFLWVLWKGALSLRDSNSDPQGENSRSEVEGEASQSGAAKTAHRPNGGV